MTITKAGEKLTYKIGFTMGNYIEELFTVIELSYSILALYMYNRKKMELLINNSLRINDTNTFRTVRTFVVI